MSQRFIWQWDVNRIPKWPQKTDHNLILVVQILKFWRVQSFWKTKSANKNHWIPEGFPKLLPVFLSKSPLEGPRTLSPETAFVVSSSKAMLVFQVFVVRGFNPFLDVPKNWRSCMKNLHWGQFALVFSGQLMKEMGKNLWNPRQKEQTVTSKPYITTDKKVWKWKNLIWVIKSPM